MATSEIALSQLVTLMDSPKLSSDGDSPQMVTLTNPYVQVFVFSSKCLIEVFRFEYFGEKSIP